MNILLTEYEYITNYIGTCLGITLKNCSCCKYILLSYWLQVALKGGSVSYLHKQ